MNVYQAYTALNTRLARGETTEDFPATEPYPPFSPGRGEALGLRYPKVGVYTGGGSSHSWLWLAEVFERLGFFDIAFWDHERIKTDNLGILDVLALSGGDTFAMAEALGEPGAAALRDFITQGGVYLGFCAGAYLPMNSSKKPLDMFNFVPAKITNLSRNLPRPLTLEDKFCTPYGCSYVFHPVREALKLKAEESGPFAKAGCFDAPLYGGPAMICGPQCQVLARYDDFTEKTLFLVERDLAARTLLGNAAALRAPLGQGMLYLFGPHFEHPRFPQANRLLAEVIHYGEPRQRKGPAEHEPKAATLSGTQAKALLRDLKREVSNARIAAWGLENHSARWLIGKKVYEPRKFLVFMEAVWSRLRALERLPGLQAPPEAEGLMVRPWGDIAQNLRLLKRELARERDTMELAAGIFADLNRASACFMEMYFNSVLPVFAGREAPRRLH